MASSSVAAANATPHGSRPRAAEGDSRSTRPADFSTRVDNSTGRWRREPLDLSEVDEEGDELEVVVTVSTRPRRSPTGSPLESSATPSAGWRAIEDTFDWYADDDGTIWYLGEDTAEFEDGEISSTAGSFEAGVDGALAGVIMPGEPVDGMRYRQEYYEGEAEDNGEILSVDEQVDVPFGHFDGVLLTKDTIALEPDVLEYKLYAPGVGPVLVLGISGGGGQEALIDVTQVSDDVARAAGTTPLGEAYG